MPFPNILHPSFPPENCKMTATISNPRVRKRTKALREAHCEEMARHYARGMSQRALAKKYNLSQSQVSKDLTAFFAKVAETYRPEKLKLLMAKEHARLEEVMRRCWRAWFRSIRPKKTRTEEALTPKSAQNYSQNGAKTPFQYKKVTYRRETRDGNPAFLRLILDCIDRVCKLFGLYSESVRQRLETGERKPLQIIRVRNSEPRSIDEPASAELGIYVI